MEKGPVDVCSHEACYSLTEDRLLREAVSDNIVVCCILQYELDEDIVVKVLFPRWVTLNDNNDDSDGNNDDNDSGKG